MKRVIAFAAGLTVSAGIAMAEPQNDAKDMVNRYYAANDEASILAEWQDWHPEATHTVTIKYGMGQPDDTFSYALSDLEKLPALSEIPEVAEAMKGYSETTRSEPNITVETEGDITTVTSVVNVDYVWDSYKGKSVETDVFKIEPLEGGQVIRSLSTTLDYQ